MNWPEWISPDGRIRLINADCLEVLPELEADCIITDPPYGIDYESGHDGCLPRRIDGDDSTEVRDAIIARKEPMAVFATWRCVPPRRPRGCLVWEKNAGGMGDLTYPWRPNFELIWIFGQGWSGHRGTSVLRASTVCTWNTGPARRIHPHQKPVDLIENLIKKAPPGVILDPCAGSFTTAIACIRTDRHCVCVEKDAQYFLDGIERCKREYDRTVLFNEAEAVA